MVTVLAYLIIALFTLVFVGAMTNERYTMGQVVTLATICGLPIAQSIFVLMGR